MQVTDQVEFDHLDLPDDHRDLIRWACNYSRRVYLAPMDKGLSGSSVWQARWQLPHDELSKLHVFKIGKVSTLIREEQAVIDIASVIEPGFPLMRLYHRDGAAIGLLRQEFMGDPKGKTTSLRQYLQDATKCATSHAAASIIESLYLDRLSAWHPKPTQPSGEPAAQTGSTLSKTLIWWRNRIRLGDAARQVGYPALSRSLSERYAMTVERLAQEVDSEGHREIELNVGPVHGDLHAQNVNIDERLKLYLIDFSSTAYTWRAVDFLVMECALKFAATPPHAILDDLILMDNVVEGGNWGDQDGIDLEPLGQCLYGDDLQKIAAAVCVVRRCALSLGAVRRAEDYRSGLIFITAGMAGIGSLLNRPFIFHSLANLLMIQRGLARSQSR